MNPGSPDPVFSSNLGGVQGRGLVLVVFHSYFALDISISCSLRPLYSG